MRILLQFGSQLLKPIQFDLDPLGAYPLPEGHLTEILHSSWVGLIAFKLSNCESSIATNRYLIEVI